jgi:hypothetical protein
VGEVTEALFIPGADRTSRWFLDDYPNQHVMSYLEKMLLHSTETPKTSGCPGYSGGATAPQITINPWPGYRHTWHHFPINRAGRALGNPSSTPVSENKDGVFQVEIIGYSDPALGRRYGCYLPELPDEGLEYLAKELAFVHREWNIPTTLPSKWPLYKVSSWAAMDDAHMTSSQYDSYKGILAHLHAPKPSSHGDVAINIRLLRSKIDRLLVPPVPAPKPPPPPPPPVVTTEVPTMLFYQLQGSAVPEIAAAVIVSDGFKMRWVQPSPGWTRLQGGIKFQTGRDIQPTGVKDLTGLGLTWVGPKPHPDFPIPEGVKVVTEE